MDNSIALEYYEAITVIEAQNYSTMVGVSSFPNMKEASRKEFKRELNKMAYPRSLKAEEKPMSFEEFMGVVKNGR